MKLKQRDRPRKRGRRVITVIAIILACVLSLSSVAVISNALTEKLTKKGPNIVNKEDEPSREGVIVMPEDRVVYYQNAKPFSSLKYAVDDHISVSSTKSIEYRVDFLDDTDNYLLLSDYDYVKIEFDLYNYLTTPVAECVFRLICKGPSSKGGMPSTQMHVGGFEDRNNLSLEFSYTSVPLMESESFHIEYLIEVDKSCPSDSRMDIYVNGELVSSGKSLANRYFTMLSNLEFKISSVSEGTVSSIGVGNLLITCSK